jgi:hypothetical protein
MPEDQDLAKQRALEKMRQKSQQYEAITTGATHPASPILDRAAKKIPGVRRSDLLKVLEGGAIDAALQRSGMLLDEEVEPKTSLIMKALDVAVRPFLAIPGLATAGVQALQGRKSAASYTLGTTRDALLAPIGKGLDTASAVSFIDTLHEMGAPTLLAWPLGLAADLFVDPTGRLRIMSYSARGMKLYKAQKIFTKGLSRAELAKHGFYHLIGLKGGLSPFGAAKGGIKGAPVIAALEKADQTVRKLPGVRSIVQNSGRLALDVAAQLKDYEAMTLIAQAVEARTGGLNPRMVADMVDDFLTTEAKKHGIDLAEMEARFLLSAEKAGGAPAKFRAARTLRKELGIKVRQMRLEGRAEDVVQRKLINVLKKIEAIEDSGFESGRMGRFVTTIEPSELTLEKFEAEATTLWHGTREGFPEEALWRAGDQVSPPARYSAGIHIGTRKAAQDRLNDTIHSFKGGNVLPSEARAAEQVIPVRLRPGVKIFRAENPMTETELMSAMLFKQKERDALIKKGYSGVAYINSIEDPGSVSYLLFHRRAVQTYDEVAQSAIKHPEQILDPLVAGHVARRQLSYAEPHPTLDPFSGEKYTYNGQPTLFQEGTDYRYDNHIYEAGPGGKKKTVLKITPSEPIEFQTPEGPIKSPQRAQLEPDNSVLYQLLTGEDPGGQVAAQHRFLTEMKAGGSPASEVEAALRWFQKYSQRALKDKRKMPEEFIVWRGGRPQEDLAHVSLNPQIARYFTDMEGGLEGEKAFKVLERLGVKKGKELYAYKVKRKDVLYDIASLADDQMRPGMSNAEAELIVPTKKLKPILVLPQPSGILSTGDQILEARVAAEIAGRYPGQVTKFAPRMTGDIREFQAKSREVFRELVWTMQSMFDEDLHTTIEAARRVFRWGDDPALAIMVTKTQRMFEGLGMLERQFGGKLATLHDVGLFYVERYLTPEAKELIGVEGRGRLARWFKEFYAYHPSMKQRVKYLQGKTIPEANEFFAKRFPQAAKELKERGLTFFSKDIHTIVNTRVPRTARSVAFGLFARNVAEMYSEPATLARIKAGWVPMGFGMALDPASERNIFRGLLDEMNLRTLNPLPFDEAGGQAHEQILKMAEALLEDPELLTHGGGGLEEKSCAPLHRRGQATVWWIRWAPT